MLVTLREYVGNAELTVTLAFDVALPTAFVHVMLKLYVPAESPEISWKLPPTAFDPLQFPEAVQLVGLLVVDHARRVVLEGRVTVEGEADKVTVGANVWFERVMVWEVQGEFAPGAS